jgi:hypothetical protein
MTKFKESIIQKSQVGLIAKVTAVQNQITDLRQRGKVIAKQQNQLREYIKKISNAISFSNK